MNASEFTSRPADDAPAVTRTEENQWQAVEAGRVVGSGDTFRRPDGRLFVSIDAWHEPVFESLAAAIRADVPAEPLHTVVDAADPESTALWQRAGFAPARREWEYVVPTDPDVTGLDAVQPPPGVTILAAGEARPGLLRALDDAIRDEIGATVGWSTMPAEVLPGLTRATPLDPSKYVVAARADRYVGLLRLAPIPRQPRIGLIAVRADDQRRGVARALLAHALGTLHRAGVATARAEAHEANAAAIALLDGIGARRAGSNLELVLR